MNCVCFLCRPSFPLPLALSISSSGMIIVILYKFMEAGTIDFTGRKLCFWFIGKHSDLGYILLKVKCIWWCLFCFGLFFSS